MVLSNSVKSFLACTLILFIVQGCRWWQENDAGNHQAVPSPKSDIPFAAAEPDVFQCYVVRSDGQHGQKTFYARKNGKLRFDLASGPAGAETILRTDKYYRLNHDKKIFTEIPQGEPSAAEPEFLSDLTFAALKQSANAKFDKIGRDGNFVKYSVKLGDSDNAEAIVYVDETTGLVVKEEFFSLKGQTDRSPAPSFVFELRDLKMEVDDTVFAIPADYKKLSWPDYLSAVRSKK